jgi:hypothetical protein
MGKVEKYKELGVLAILWEVWNSEHENIVNSDHQLFHNAIIAQLTEIKEHLAKGEEQRAVDEVIDMISISQNWLRKFGLDKLGVARAISSRARDRYEGKTRMIMKKYGWPGD